MVIDGSNHGLDFSTRDMGSHILYPDDMETVHDPMWPHLDTIGYGNGASTKTNAAKSGQGGRPLYPSDISTMDDRQWPYLDRL